MKKNPSSFSLLTKITYYLGLALITFILSCVFFYLFLVTYYLIFQPPTPTTAIKDGTLQVSGQIISKDEKYLLLKREFCNVDDCHMLESEMRFKSEPFDFSLNWTNDEVVTLYVNKVEASESDDKYQNIYTHYRIDRGVEVTSLIGLSKFLCLIFAVASAVGVVFFVRKTKT